MRRERAVIRLLEQDAEHQHRQTAEPDLPGDHDERRHRQRRRVEDVANRKQNRGGEQQGDADDLSAVERKSVAAQQDGDAADAEHEGGDIHQRRADAGQRPGQQRGPDRHGVDDQRAFADGDELHRDGAKSHPGEDVGEGREQQPGDRLARDLKRLPHAIAIENRMSALATPASPRANSGGHSCSSSFINGQFSAQPKAVTPRQRNPIHLLRRAASMARLAGARRRLYTAKCMATESMRRSILGTRPGAGACTGKMDLATRPDIA